MIYHGTADEQSSGINTLDNGGPTEAVVGVEHAVTTEAWDAMGHWAYCAADNKACWTYTGPDATFRVTWDGPIGANIVGDINMQFGLYSAFHNEGSIVATDGTGVGIRLNTAQRTTGSTTLGVGTPDPHDHTTAQDWMSRHITDVFAMDSGDSFGFVEELLAGIGYVELSASHEVIVEAMQISPPCRP